MQAIIFDFDGVIVDSEPLHYQAFLEVVEPLGKSFDYETYLQKYVGLDDRDFFKEVLAEALGDCEVVTSSQLSVLIEQKQRKFNEIVASGVKTIPGSLKLIDEAASAMPIAIASGATREDIDLILSQLGYADRFEVIVSANDVAKSKPDPATYAQAVEQLRAKGYDLQAKRCLAIEDTAAGIASARGSGLQVLGLTTTGPASLLTEAGRVVDTLEDVNVETLKSWFAD